MVLFAAQLGKPTYSSRWTWELVQQKQAIAASAVSPKLVIGGGSSSLFGIRAKVLAEELHVPTYNMATYAALGLSYMLHQLEGVLSEGDTVVLSLEYELYAHDPFPPQVDYLSAHDAGHFGRLPLLRQLNGIFRMDLGRVLSPWLEPPTDEGYRNPLNAYEAKYQLDDFGDDLGNNAVLKNDNSRRLVASLQSIPIELHEPNMREIAEFAAWANAHRVRVLATHPSLMDFGPDFRRRVARTMDAIDAFHQQIGMPFVDRWDEVMFPRSMYFDTIYHLDSVAAGFRTHALAARLSRFIEPSPGSQPVPARVIPDHPLAQLARSFSGWEPIYGFGAMEGPYPQWELGPVIWALAPRSQLVARRQGRKNERLCATLRGSAAGQRTALYVNLERQGELTFDDDRTWREWCLPVVLRAGENSILFDHERSKPQAILIRALTIRDDLYH